VLIGKITHVQSLRRGQAVLDFAMAACTGCTREVQVLAG
jgi:hypothetical protein